MTVGAELLRSQIVFCVGYQSGILRPDSGSAPAMSYLYAQHSYIVQRHALRERQPPLEAGLMVKEAGAAAVDSVPLEATGSRRLTSKAVPHNLQCGSDASQRKDSRKSISLNGR